MDEPSIKPNEVSFGAKEVSVKAKETSTAMNEGSLVAIEPSFGAKEVSLALNGLSMGTKVVSFGANEPGQRRFKAANSIQARSSRGKSSLRSSQRTGHRVWRLRGERRGGFALFVGWDWVKTTA